jgi:hypothetical protein
MPGLPIQLGEGEVSAPDAVGKVAGWPPVWLHLREWRIPTNGQRGNRTPDTRILRASAACPLRAAENG